MGRRTRACRGRGPSSPGWSSENGKKEEEKEKETEQGIFFFLLSFFCKRGFFSDLFKTLLFLLLRAIIAELYQVFFSLYHKGKALSWGRVSFYFFPFASARFKEVENKFLVSFFWKRGKKRGGRRSPRANLSLYFASVGTLSLALYLHFFCLNCSLSDVGVPGVGRRRGGAASCCSRCRSGQEQQ